MIKEITFVHTSYTLLANKINSHTDIYIYKSIKKLWQSIIINKLYNVKGNIIRIYNITNTCIKSISKKLALKFMKWLLISTVFMQKFPIPTS